MSWVGLCGGLDGCCPRDLPRDRGVFCCWTTNPHINLGWATRRALAFSDFTGRRIVYFFFKHHMAESVGFEPTHPSRSVQFSRLVPSARLGQLSTIVNLLGAPGKTRTCTPWSGQKGLSLPCLPFHHRRITKAQHGVEPLSVYSPYIDTPKRVWVFTPPVLPLH